MRRAYERALAEPAWSPAGGASTATSPGSAIFVLERERRAPPGGAGRRGRRPNDARWPRGGADSRAFIRASRGSRWTTAAGCRARARGRGRALPHRPLPEPCRRVRLLWSGASKARPWFESVRGLRSRAATRRTPRSRTAISRSRAAFGSGRAAAGRVREAQQLADHTGVNMNEMRYGGGSRSIPTAATPRRPSRPPRTSSARRSALGTR